jgi:hypothetical protein
MTRCKFESGCGNEKPRKTLTVRRGTVPFRAGCDEIRESGTCCATDFPFLWDLGDEGYLTRVVCMVCRTNGV